MGKFRLAEQLYLQSIRISEFFLILLFRINNLQVKSLSLFFVDLKLFGPAYSGLEYDYRGLCNVYEKLEDRENFLKYQDITENWRVLRTENEEGRVSVFIFYSFFKVLKKVL